MPYSTSVILIGYSGHGFVVADTLLASGRLISGYCDREEKVLNPHQLPYLGEETGQEGLRALAANRFFCAIGDNRIRARVTASLLNQSLALADPAIDPSCRVSPHATIGIGALLAPFATVNAMAVIGTGAIINTGATVEHECIVGRFAHVAPGAVVTGNVSIGDGAFVSAGAIILPGIRIGAHATVGAGAVVLRDVPAGATVYGNPAKEKP